jgi:hypothetical protein
MHAIALASSQRRSNPMISNRMRRDFRRFLETSGYCTPPGRAACALRSARTLADFRKQDRYVIECKEEEENYFSVYGEPDTKAERIRMENSLERFGCWYVYCRDTVTDEVVDGIGMCTGYASPTDPFCNDYVTDLMAAALAITPDRECPTCHGAGRVAA